MARVLSFVSTVFLAVLSREVVEARDLTREPEESGSQVVEACMALIIQSGIFPPDHNLMRRIAWVESKDGTDPNTYRVRYHGGIWQVDSVGFDSTQDMASHPALVGKHQEIANHFGIQWAEVTWTDLRKPLYSALAARLYLSNKLPEIPDTLEGQAAYWKQHYNSHDPNAAGTVEKFMEDVGELESRGSDCDFTNAKMLITLVLDGSGSIGLGNYQQALGFLAELVTQLELREQGTMVAMLYFDRRVFFHFNFTTDVSTVQSEILGTPYPGGQTYTGAAIDAAVELFEPFNGEQYRGWNRICIVLTDGLAHDSVVEPASRAQAAGINMLAVGIGDTVDQSTLLGISNNIAGHVIHVGSYTSITNILWSLAESTCKVAVQLEMPDQPSVETTVRSSVAKDKLRYVASPVPEEGITISLENLEGSVIGYASYRISTPSRAFFDYEVRGGEQTFVPSPSRDGSSARRLQEEGASNVTHILYMGYEGEKDVNSFQVSVSLGDSTDGYANLGNRPFACVGMLLVVALRSIGAMSF